MTRYLLFAALLVLLDGSSYAQPTYAAPALQSNYAIQMSADGQVRFNWQQVEQCARLPDQLYCKIAWAARQECGRGS